MKHVRSTLKVLCDYYCSNEGKPRQMNPVQITVYVDGLKDFSADELEAAARQWMKDSKWFPALSDLLNLLVPKVDSQTAGHLAWACVEKAIRQAGVYRGATFEDGRIGEAVRQTFGSWGGACVFDVDSPGWAIRRQTFLSIFGSLMGRGLPPVTLPGLQVSTPLVVEALPSLPVPKQLDTHYEPPTHQEAVAVLKRVGMLPANSRTP